MNKGIVENEVVTITHQDSDKIKKISMELDNALEKMNIEEIVHFFAEDCEIELLNVKLFGKTGARKWLQWFFNHISEIQFKPVIILVDGNVFFEEFIVKAKLHDGTIVESKQAEVLIYKNYQIQSLRLYFDRLDFADAVAKDFISKGIIKQLIKKSTKGLT